MLVLCDMSIGMAAMTRTRVDSAAKHIMPAKIDTNLMKIYSGIPNADLQYLHHNKLDYLTEKDDLVLNVSRKVSTVDARTFHAYPAVVSTLGKCTEAYTLILAVLYSRKTAKDFYEMTKAIEETDKVTKVYEFISNTNVDELGASGQKFMETYNNMDELRNAGDNLLVTELRTMPFYQLQGYSLGRAWASPLSGDTVFSVLIGGCVTAINGCFAMQAGQLVQWYFDFEAQFYANVNTRDHVVGQRQGNNMVRPAALAQKRRRLEEPKRKNFAYPKPYVPNWDGEVYGDKIRIFGKCLNGAGPYEPVDIMIMTQSL